MSSSRVLYYLLTSLLYVLTDLVLKDKIIVYDLAGQRIGWANYDCKFQLHYQKDI